MTWWLFVSAALVLGIERIAYVLICGDSKGFQSWCARSPVRRFRNPVGAVRDLFLICKVIQASTFAAWIYMHGGGIVRLPGGRRLATAAGSAAILVGQLLNLGVFLRLGATGVFYGSRFGYDVPWCRGFPFSIVAHPQYVGTVLTIWGVFLILRFPYSDWYLLPGLETAYYAVGARFERDLRTSPPPTASAPTTHGTAPASRLTLT
jgi:methylene-fatty-acyl-phospholipid synthase